jgi:phthalate 4,5-cis-dihydrodiol dehydrogenase
MLKQCTHSNKLRIGFIGLGGHAWENLLPALATTDDLELTAISSRTPDKIQRFSRRFKPQLTTDIWQDLLDTSRIDAIVISASPQLHYEVTKECLKRNIHCFIEKPPTQNLEQLQELLEIKKTSQSKTFVGYNFTYSDAYTKLTKLLGGSSIRIGKFRFIVGKLNQPTDGFKTVLESCLYKMLIHPMHTLIDTFGPVARFEILEQTLNNNKFAMQVGFTFASGAVASLDWGNYSNRFECKFELTNQNGETGMLDNMGHYEVWNAEKQHFDSQVFKHKERLVFDNSPLLGGFERTGYQREFELWRDAIQNSELSQNELEKSLEIYRIIEEIKIKSTIPF